MTFACAGWFTASRTVTTTRPFARRTSRYGSDDVPLPANAPVPEIFPVLSLPLDSCAETARLCAVRTFWKR